MSVLSTKNIDVNRPFKLAQDVYWVGFYESATGTHANPYLIVDGDEAVVIDGGSRSDFPQVMMKIMQTGIVPYTIVALICQNYDPRLCGSIPHMEGIIDRENLKIISDEANHMFIRHYCESAELVGLQDINYEFHFSSGRCLQFIRTPYAHSAGSFVTFDHQSGTLFTSALFSCYALEWQLLLKLEPECYQSASCTTASCPIHCGYCIVEDILRFHANIMPSERALKFALEQIVRVPFTMIAPQHGRIIHAAEDLMLLCDRLASLQGVGIDGLIGNRAFSELGDTTPLKKRLNHK
jgi:flavorubredoxin